MRVLHLEWASDVESGMGIRRDEQKGMSGLCAWSVMYLSLTYGLMNE